MRFLARLILNALAILVAAWLVPGLELSSNGAALAAGIILGFVNAIVRPVLLLLTLPFTLLTLGLFIFVVNAVCLALTAALIRGFEIDGWWSALLGAFVVSVVSWILNGLLLPRRAEPRR
ncbi:MAG TPA: phage holin family protein [Vicinamibacterales bacterium]|nr:phage holin family protein [Vicinamibacterales bacterium]